MKHILLHQGDDRSSSFLIAVDPSRFHLQIPDAPIDLVQSLLETNDGHPHTLLSRIEKRGAACGAGVIFPGAIEIVSIPTYLRPPHDLEIGRDLKARTVQINGGKTRDQWGLRLCYARSQFAEKEPRFLQHPFQDFPGDRIEEIQMAVPAVSFALGLWKEIGQKCPAHFTASLLKMLGPFLAVGCAIDDEGRSYDNFVGVTANRVERAKGLMEREAALIGNRPINPDWMVDGPQLPAFLELADRDLVSAGRRVGQIACEHDEETLMTASYLLHVDTKGLSIPNDGAFRDFDPQRLSAHEQIEAAQIKSQLLQACAAQVPA